MNRTRPFDIQWLARRITTRFGMAAVLLVVVSCVTETSLQISSPRIGGFEASPEASVLLVVGDWGAGTQAQVEVAAAMRERSIQGAPQAILTTGDNFYSDDVATLMEPFEWATDAEVPIWLTWGNHDIESRARIEGVVEQFGDPPRWQLIEWGALDLVLLDSNQVDAATQIEFLKDTMQGSDRPAIVVFHHPAYNCGRHPNRDDIVEHWLSHFDHDVLLVLTGHDHNYQRFQDGEVTHVVTGGGGRHLYELDQCPEGHPPLLAGESIHHFLVVTQDEKSILIEAIATDGRTIDLIRIPLN